MHNYTDHVTTAPQGEEGPPSGHVHQSHPGVTRVQMGAPAREALTVAPSDSARVYGGTTRHGAEGGESLQTSRHIVSHEGTAGGSVMATMQRQGLHQTVELIPGQASSRTVLAVALAEGVIRETRPGVYEDVAGKPAAIAADLDAAPAEVNADPGAEVFDAADDQTWAAAIEPLAQHAYDATAASAVLAVVTGGDLSDAARTLAGNTGMEPELAQQYVQAGVAMHERAVARAVAPLGIESPERKAEFYAWARGQQGLQEAVQRLVHTRDASGFQKLAQAFKRASPGDLSPWTSAGFETHVGFDGDLMVKRAGGNWIKATELAK